MTENIYASMRYHDGRAALDWLERAFGLERSVAYDGPDGNIGHAELRWGEGTIMIGTWRGEDDLRRPGQGWAYVAVEDIEGHLRRAREAGAEIVAGLDTQDYGRFYSARDLDGNLWSFGTYAP